MSVAKIISKVYTRGFAFFLLIFVFECIFLRLAFWQYERMGEKEAAFALYEQQLKNPPADKVEWANVSDWQIVRLKGSFVYDDEKLLQNRKYKSYTGYRLIAPLVMENGDVILVDRGWIPTTFEREDPKLFRESEEVVEFTGVVRLIPPMKGWLSGPLYGTSNKVIKRIDSTAFSTGVEYKNILIQSASSTNRNIRSFIEKPQTGARHAEYMLTWLSIAFIVASLYALFLFQTRRASK